MKKAIVYSALHTGTWFTCGILTEATKEHADYRADMWINQGAAIATKNHPDRPETNSIVEKALRSGRMQEFDALINLQESRGLGLPDYIDMFVLQAHNRGTSPFYEYIRDFKPEIPIVIPFRDPLLSINTRAWRECGSMKALLEEHIDNRKYRVRDQLASIIRLISIPESHAYKYAIDVERSDSRKIEIFNEIIDFAGLTPNDEQIAQRAAEWMPVNPTIGGSFVQRNNHMIEEDEFVLTKNAIIGGDIELVKSYMDIEVELTQTMLAYFKPQLEDLGYKDLSWW